MELDPRSLSAPDYENPFQNAERAWIERDRIANTWSPEKLLAFTAKKVGKDTVTLAG